MRMEDLGVMKNVIMVDDKNIINLDKAKRDIAVESYCKFADAAKILDFTSVSIWEV